MSSYLKRLGLLPSDPPRDLTALKPHQLQFVLLHIQGKKLSEIAEETGDSLSYVSTVLRSEAAKNIIRDFYQFQDQEFQALYSDAVEAIRKGLQSDDQNIALKASKMWLESHGKSKQRDLGHATAEDVVRRIMEIRLVEETPAK